MPFTPYRSNLPLLVSCLAFVCSTVSCAATVGDAEEKEPTQADESAQVVVADLGTLTGAGGVSQAFAINEHGTIAGLSFDSTGASRAVVWVNRRLQALPLPAGTVNSVALDVNVSDVAVGWRSDTNGRNRAVRWTGTTSAADLAPTFNGDTVAEAINDRGEIV